MSGGQAGFIVVLFELIFWIIFTAIEVDDGTPHPAHAAFIGLLIAHVVIAFLVGALWLFFHYVWPWLGTIG